MKLWISCEATIELAESFRLVRGKLEKTINNDLEKFHSKSGFTKWAVIAIIRPDDHPDYQEFVKANKRTKVLEFRLKMDYTKFFEADEGKRTILLSELLLRSTEKMKEIPIDENEISYLSQVVSQYSYT